MHFMTDRYVKTSRTKKRVEIAVSISKYGRFCVGVVNHPPFCVSDIIIQLIIFGNFVKICFFPCYYHTRQKHFVSGDRENKCTRNYWNFTIRENKSTRNMTKFSSAKINLPVFVRHEIALFWSFWGFPTPPTLP